MKGLTFGEIMLRLCAPNHERLFQTPSLEATFGGGEANTAVSLANYGMDVQFCTVLPDNLVGDACISELRRFGVDVSKIQRGPGRMGIYYLETGANQLPSKVVYDRLYSSLSLAKPSDIDWNVAFQGVNWFHITGITPAISETAIKGQLKELVRGSVEETLNELLEAEAKLPGMSAMSSAKATAAATTTVISLPLPETSHSRCPSSRESPLRPPSLSGIAAVKAAWKKLSLRCIWQAYPSGAWRILPRLCGAARCLRPPSVS